MQIFQTFSQHGSQDRALAQKSTSRALVHNIWTVWSPIKKAPAHYGSQVRARGANMSGIYTP